MNKMIAFVFVSLFAMIAFAQELPVDNQQSVMPTDQSAVPAEMTLPECKEKLANCGKEVSDLQVKVDECKKKMAGKKNAGKKQPAANIAVGTADKISKEADKLPDGPEKTAIKEAAEAVIQSKTADETLERFKDLDDKIDEVKDEIISRVKELEDGQKAQDTKITNAESRLDKIEEGIFSGYFGAVFMTSSLFDTAGGGTIGTLIKVGNLKGKFKLDLGATVYGSEVKNLLGFEGRGLIRWASEDFEYLNIGLGGAGGMMSDINNAGNIANAYGGGMAEIEAVFKKHYGVVASVLIGASDSQDINGAHKTSFCWQFILGARYHF